MPKLSIADMVSMRYAGFSYRHIADRAGVSRTAVTNVIKPFHVVPAAPVAYELPSHRRHDHISNAYLHRLYWDEGKSFREIGVILGWGPRAENRVGGLFDRRGIPRRTLSEARVLAEKKHPSVAKWSMSSEHARELNRRSNAARKARKAADAAREPERRARREAYWADPEGRERDNARKRAARARAKG